MTSGGTTVYYRGNRIVEYAYGPFGQLLEVYGSAASTLGALNPLRYRGYYYNSVN